MNGSDGIRAALAAMPLGQRIAAGASLAVAVVAAAAFFVWVSQPAYTVLYAGLDDSGVGEVAEALDGLGVPYRIGAGRIEVPRSELYQVRAALAEEGISGTPQVPGYELLDDQGMSVSSFQQEVDYQRALEGELTRTIEAMTAVDAASVHLSIPERAVFQDEQEPAAASIVVTPRGDGLGPDQVDAIAAVVAGAVVGLDSDHVTVADSSGQTLHSTGGSAGTADAASRQQRSTREFEQQLTDDVARLLDNSIGPGRANVTVRAVLDFDSRETESEAHDPDSQVATAEQIIEERYEGSDVGPGGEIGLDAEALGQFEGEIDYERDESTTQYAVDRIVERVVSAPGGVDQLSVAVVLDDGTNTGEPAPPADQIEGLVVAALGLDLFDGDQINVALLPFPGQPPAPEPPDGVGVWVGSNLSALTAGLILLLSAGALAFMLRRRRPAPAAAAGGGDSDGGGVPGESGSGTSLKPALIDDESLVGGNEAVSSARRLLNTNPDEVAELLHRWLADD